MAPVSLERHGPVGIIRLDRGKKVPVLDRAALRGLDEALGEAEAGGARCLVLTGGGAGVFAAGANLQELRQLDPSSARALARRGQRVLERLESCPAIIIAAIAGKCIGGAFDLAMACDLRVAAEGTVFEHPGPKMGFITGWGGTSRLPRMVGPGAASILGGLSKLEAGEACRAGLVVRVVPRQRLESECLEMAGKIASAEESRTRTVKAALRSLSSLRGNGLLERRWTALLRRGGP